MSRNRKHKKQDGTTDNSPESEREEPKSFVGKGHCAVCGTPLCTRGGCAGTGMCGPCCTGEADTAGEY
jgi:hypothetical protein